MQDFKGSELKKIREERNIPLEQVASDTRIRLSILQDLEDNAYSELSSSTQAKGFLRLYAQYLGVDKREPEFPAAPTPAPLLEPVQPKPASQPQPDQVSLPEPKPKPEIIITNDTKAEPYVAGAEASFAPLESTRILEMIGRELSARRRYLNIGWDIIQEQIHITKVQIQTLERGDLNAMPNPMQYKGLLQTYARFLNLDVESIMIRYADALQNRRLESSVLKRRQRRPGKVLPPILVSLKRLFTLDLFFGTLLILGILGFLIWGIARMSEATQAPQTTGTLPAVADMLLSETTEPTPTALEPTSDQDPLTIPTVTPFFTGIVSDEPIEVVLLARQNVWLRITSDGKVSFEGRMKDGEVLSFTAQESLELETGNIIALEIMHNQTRLEPLSDRLGTAASIIFTIDGVQELPITSPDLQPTPTP
jgi:cytoskeletal protein RodZ